MLMFQKKQDKYVIETLAKHSPSEAVINMIPTNIEENKQLYL